MDTVHAPVTAHQHVPAPGAELAAGEAADGAVHAVARLAAREGRARRERLPAAVWIIAAVAYAAEVAVSSRYGFDRDELYFLIAGRHLAAGYVDQPPLVPLLARLAALLTGNTLVGLRSVVALGLPAVVALTASMARMLGAGRGSQAVAALAAACCGEYLGVFHRFTTTPVDVVFWALLLWIVVRLLTSGDRRWWLPAGAVAGAGLEAKWNIAFLVAGLAAGFAAARLPLRRGKTAGMAGGRWLAAGCAVMVILIAPDLIWQAVHGLPNISVYRHLQQSAWHERLIYWPGQIGYTSVVLVPLWARGLWRLLRETALRPAGIAAAFVLGVQFLLGGKPYYPAGIYPLLLAAGSAGLALTAARAARYCAAGLVAALVALPVLPAASISFPGLQAINPELSEQVGWPGEIRLVAQVYRSLPPAQRARAAVLTGNYGEAGAVDYFGPPLGLPQAYSGHNNFWLWGPPPARDSVVVALGEDPSVLRRDFASVRQVAVYRNSLGVRNTEEGARIYLATGMRAPWVAAWPEFRHYD